MFIEKGGENLLSENDFAEVCVAGEENLARNTYLTVVLLTKSWNTQSHTDYIFSSSILSCHKMDGFRNHVVRKLKENNGF